MDNTTYIESYLEGNMSADEKLQFEALLKADPVLAAEFNGYSAAYALVKCNGALQAKEILQRHEVAKYGNNNTRLLKIIISSAAAIVLVTTLFYFLQSKGEGLQDDLFTTYYTHYRDPISVRSDAVMSDMRDKANRAFSTKDFIAAESYYSQVSDPTPADKLYHGLSALQNSNMHMAITLLEEVSHSQSDYTQQATWYLALAYLKAGKKGESADILRTIVKENAYPHEKAQELLNKLEAEN